MVLFLGRSGRSKGRASNPLSDEQEVLLDLDLEEDVRG